MLQQLSTFRIVKKLGEGGMGAVYLAEDTAAQRQVALKVLPEQLSKNTEFIKRFYREARATGKLNHENIVSAYTVGEEGGVNYFAMEYCPGQSLDRIIKAGPVEWKRATEIILQVARGLLHAHKHGFIHRDIKPHNIILGEDGVAKILDMGLSKNIVEGEQSFNTQTGAMLGTPHYIAPEQARGDKQIDGRVDIYSLGATFFHLVTGKTPYDGPTAMAIIARHMTEAPPDAGAVNAAVPSAVAYLIRRMMAKSPDDRHRDCALLIEDLESVKAGKLPGTMAEAAFERTTTLPGIDAPQRRSTDKTAVAEDSRSGRDRRAGDRRGQDRPQKKNKALIIGGVLAASAAAVLVALLMRPGRQRPLDPPAPADSTAGVATVHPAGAPSQNTIPSPPPAGAAGQSAGAWINLLALSQKLDIRRGEWSLENGALRSGSGPFATVQFPYQLPEEYDFRVTFTVQSGTPDFNQMIVKQGRCFHYMVGGNGNRVFGFAKFDDDWRAQHASTVRRDPALQLNRKYVSEVRVRRGSISTFLDGQPVTLLSSDFERLVPAAEANIADQTLPGILAHNCVVVAHAVEVREVADSDSPARPK